MGFDAAFDRDLVNNAADPDPSQRKVTQILSKDYYPCRDESRERVRRSVIKVPVDRFPKQALQKRERA